MKRKFYIWFLILPIFLILVSFYRRNQINIGENITDILRETYSLKSVSEWPSPHIDSVIIKDFEDIGPLPAMPYPKNNPYSREKEALGKILFFDAKLSSSQQIACASCHDPSLAWGDGREVAFGHDRQVGKRNAMTIFNVGFYRENLFWDGRAQTLEEQIKFPLTNKVEMHSEIDIAVKNIQEIEAYKDLFIKAFGDDSISYDRISKAIATFERSIISSSSKFDKFINGNSSIFTDQEVQGLHLFRTKARCINCHYTPLFSDSKMHNIGLVYYDRKFEDLGLYYNTKRAADVGKMRTPSLREIGRTAPYMHNGLFPHLEGIINLYNAGMVYPRRTPKYENDTLFPITSPLLKPLNLTVEEQEALEAFLRTLDSRYYRVRPPKLPR